MGGMTGSEWRAASPRAWIGRLFGGPGFTATEVRDLLATGDDGARARAARRCLARPGDWLNPPPDAFDFPWRYQRHLPRIAYWHARGESLAAIEAEFGGVMSAWAVERGLVIACARIAACLNRDPGAYGLAR